MLAEFSSRSDSTFSTLSGVSSDVCFCPAMAPKSIESSADFDKALEEAGDKLVVVDFYADWCGPCKKIAPEIVKLSEELTDVVFLKVNVDEVEELAQKQGIRAMPTFKFFKNKEAIPDSEFAGASLDKLKAAISKFK